MVLGPDKDKDKAAAGGRAWDSQMVEYASVWADPPPAAGAAQRLGLFYAGNGYGATGIGYAESAVL
jgi:hypothetical protein